MAETSLPPEMAPSRYIEKVSLVTGETLDEEILPRQLLASNHRDYHIVDVHARFMMSRVVKATGDEDRARLRMKEMRSLGRRTSKVLARMVGESDSEKVSKALFGLKDREYYFRYKKHHLDREEIHRRLSELRRQAEEKMAAVTGEDGRPRLRVLLTGGTGFVGKEIIWQAAQDDSIVEMVVLIRPKEVRDRKTGELIETIPPAARGDQLLHQLWLDDPAVRAKFRFVAGDITEPSLGVSEDEIEGFKSTLTHVIHCAASVAFDDPYEESYRANVTGSLNALRFSHLLQESPGSPFIAHLAIETSYIHGRQVKQLAREDEVVFPRNFYNNYYELTKAMASIDTERFMLEKGLRVVQLCPAIVIGDARTGNNRGDTKVVNAPVNIFGRASRALSKSAGSWVERSKVSMLARLACVFPGDPSAQINLVPVDRVVTGILSALSRPRAVGQRVHLATDNRITSQEIRDIVHQELGVDVKLAEPTLHRNVTLPLLTRVLRRLQQDKLAYALKKLGTIFGGYSEWGQPVHEVGKDVDVLGLSAERPNTRYVFRMLCRHNKVVQDFGLVRDLDEISRRERVWADFIEDLEGRHQQPAGALDADTFHRELTSGLDLESFQRIAGA